MPSRFASLSGRASALAATLALGVLLPAESAPAATVTPPKRTPAEVLAQSPAADWRALDPDNTLVMQLALGQVLIELAPRFAPEHAANLRALARGGYWDGLAVIRVQDNYVAQWADPAADEPATSATPPRALPAQAREQLPAEFGVPLKQLPARQIHWLPDTDGWAPRTGFLDGFGMAADPKQGSAWLTHCYGSVGAARGNPPDSSNGTQLYAVIGHAPRALDRNITVVGRVIQGIEWLATLPRGRGTRGFYQAGEANTPLQRLQLMSALPEAERPRLQLLRTDSATWRAYVDARRHRSGWFVNDPAHVEVCSLTPPTRPTP